MIHRSHRFVAAGIVAALMLLFTASRADAQLGAPWGACGATNVCNFTNCPVTLTLLTFPAGGLCPIVLQAGQCINIPTPGIASIDWVVSALPALYPVLPPPPAPPSTCLPTDWSVNCVTLPPGNCCCDVCFDPILCTISINNAACPPGACNP